MIQYSHNKCCTRKPHSNTSYKRTNTNPYRPFRCIQSNKKYRTNQKCCTTNDGCFPITYFQEYVSGKSRGSGHPTDIIVNVKPATTAVRPITPCTYVGKKLDKPIMIAPDVKVAI